MPINSPRYRWSELDGEQRAELNQQIVDLTEAFLDDITHLQAGQSFAETTLVDYLPRQFLPYYNLAFAKRFVIAFLTVTWKLTDPEAVHNCANQGRGAGAVRADPGHARRAAGQRRRPGGF